MPACTASLVGQLFTTCHFEIYFSRNSYASVPNTCLPIGPPQIGTGFRQARTTLHYSFIRQLVSPRGVTVPRGGAWCTRLTLGWAVEQYFTPGNLLGDAFLQGDVGRIII